VKGKLTEPLAGHGGGQSIDFHLDLVQLSVKLHSEGLGLLSHLGESWLNDVLIESDGLLLKNLKLLADGIDIHSSGLVGGLHQHHVLVVGTVELASGLLVVSRDRFHLLAVDWHDLLKVVTELEGVGLASHLGLGSDVHVLDKLLELRLQVINLGLKSKSSYKNHKSIPSLVCIPG